jgi:L-fuconolactonase
MDIVDAQIHVWDEDRPGARWNPEFAEPRASFLLQGPPMTIDRAVAAMDAVGVTGALVTAFLLYDKIDYAARAVREHPDRFRLVTDIDLTLPDPAGLVRRQHAKASLTAIRLVFLSDRPGEHYEDLRRGTFDPIFKVAGDLGLPVMLVVSGDAREASPLAARFPGLTLVIDHLGLLQGPNRQPSPQPFEHLPELLALSRHPNVFVKLSGVPTLSKQPYPFPDVWAHVRRVLDAFGPERVIWGSDFSRTRPMHPYAEALGYVLHTDLLTDHEKSLVLGANARRLFSWPK